MDKPLGLTEKQASKIAGTLSAPSKMPCHGYSISAKRCIAGAKLATIAGSTCAKCYALKGNYRFSNVQTAMEFRYESLTNPLWVDAMATLILATGQQYFRWHDSGDLQSVAHFARISEVCRKTPRVAHWLPTREYKIVLDYLKNGGTIPDNLCVRFSAHMVDRRAADYGFPTSTVHTGEITNPLQILNTIPANTHFCPAQLQGNKCGQCRACWQRSVKNVSYHQH